MHCHLQPDVLQDLTQLTHLTLRLVSVHCKAGAFLRLMSCLRDLRHLHLNDVRQFTDSSQPCNCQWPCRCSNYWGTDLASYTALLASSKLQELNVAECDFPELLRHLEPCTSSTAPSAARSMNI